MKGRINQKIKKMIKKIIKYFKDKKEKKGEREKLIKEGMEMGNSRIYCEYVVDHHLKNSNWEIDN